MASTTFIAVLRGINVSGRNKILMPDLKDLLERNGFKKVRTYIQSGNVLLDTAAMQAGSIAEKIAHAIREKYGFDVPVIVRNIGELESIVAGNPFLKEKDIDESKLHVTLLSDMPAPAHLKNMESLSFPPDRFHISGKTVYLHCPVNYGETRLSNAFFENKLKVQATTRNWKTINKLIALAAEH